MKFISLAIFISNLTKDSIDLWMQPRTEEGSLKGYWEFPGGNIEQGESPLEATIREVKEEVDLDIQEKNIQRFNNFNFQVNSDTSIEFFTFIVRSVKPEKNRGEWFTIKLDDFENSLPEKVPPANNQLIKNICLAFKNIDPKDFDLIWTQ